MHRCDVLVVTGTSRTSKRSFDMCSRVAQEFGAPDTLLIVGGAPGVDKDMELIWEGRGFPVWVIKPAWAAPRQLVAWADKAHNSAIVAAAAEYARRGSYVLSVALQDNDSVGTWDCVTRLKATGIRVEVRQVDVKMKEDGSG